MLGHELISEVVLLFFFKFFFFYLVKYLGKVFIFYLTIGYPLSLLCDVNQADLSQSAVTDLYGLTKAYTL